MKMMDWIGKSRKFTSPLSAIGLDLIAAVHRSQFKFD